MIGGTLLCHNNSTFSDSSVSILQAAIPGLISDNGGGVEDHALSVCLHLVETEVGTDVVVAVGRHVGQDGLQLAVDDGPVGAGGRGRLATAVVLYLERRLAGQ